MPPKNDRKADKTTIDSAPKPDNREAKQEKDDASLRFACLQLAAQLYGQQMPTAAVLDVASDMLDFVLNRETPPAPDDLDFNDADTDLDVDAAGEQG